MDFKLKPFRRFRVSVEMKLHVVHGASRFFNKVRVAAVCFLSNVTVREGHINLHKNRSIVMLLGDLSYLRLCYIPQHPVCSVNELFSKQSINQSANQTGS